MGRRLGGGNRDEEELFLDRIQFASAYYTWFCLGNL